MKKLKIQLLSLLIALSFNSFANDAYFLMDPTLDPEGNFIVFSYDGDLWRVSVEGGVANRITAMDGNESRPNISPDGKWLAFSGTQFGNKDIYIMPLEGGEIQRLTYHESFDDVDSWSWDSKKIYFTSNRYNRYTAYEIGINGGTPKRLFGHYFNSIHNVVEHPSTKEIFFNETWESKSFAHRKRYKGDYNPDIKSYNRKTGAYTKHTIYIGKDFGATIDRRGNTYFKSDEANGEYNLYTFDGKIKKQLTHFNSSVYWPKVSANGDKIVFRKDYQLFVYDVNSGKTEQPHIKLNRSATLSQEQNFNVKDKISNFDVSSDKKKIAFVSRGVLFVSDIEGKFIKKIKTNPKEAVGEVKWLKDNKTLLFSQSDNGYYNLFSISAVNGEKLTQHTSDSQNNRQFNFNSEKTQAVYLSGRNEIRLMDLESYESETIVEDELWAMYNPDPHFSPDDRFIVYNAYRDFEQDIFVYDIEKKESKNLTNTKVSETDPFWSPDGKYLYFSSDLLNPGYPYGTKDARIYRMALDNYSGPFQSDKLEEIFKEEEKKDEEEKEEAKEEESAKEEDASEDEKVKDSKEELVSINFVDLMERLEQISPSHGQQFSPYVIQNGDKTIVLYSSNHDEGKYNLWKTTIQDFEENKTEKVNKETLGGYQIVSADDTYYIRMGGNIHKLQAEDNKLTKIEISHTFRKALSNEFKQMFYEAWAGFEENFYNEDFHGQDWIALRDKYSRFLPHVTQRTHLRRIINDMLGELNTSHFGFNSSGKEESTYFGLRSLSTGILFDNENPYVVDRLVKQSPADKKGVDLLKGDVLTKINGETVDQTKNREQYFSMPSIDKEVVLTFARDGKEMDVKLHTTSFFTVRNLMYDEWQDENQDYVDKASNGKIAYVHMKNMGRSEFNKFKQDIVREGAYKDGLILDLRYNTGGNVHDDVLRLLSQRSYLKWKYREGAFTKQSNFSPSDKPIVLLVNEQSLSDAEMTANGFKELGLGQVVGTETYRWIIFTSGKSLVDGSFYRLPSWGCYTLDGKNLEKTGVEPDIRVDKDFKDRLENNHPQLDKAIELILENIGR